MNDSEIAEIFQYVLQPGVLTIGEREIAEGLQKHYDEYGRLTEIQTRTLLEFKKYREKQSQHLY